MNKLMNTNEYGQSFTVLKSTQMVVAVLFYMQTNNFKFEYFHMLDFIIWRPSEYDVMMIIFFLVVWFHLVHLLIVFFIESKCKYGLLVIINLWLEKNPQNS